MEQKYTIIIVATYLFSLIPTYISAQRHEILSPEIKSLEIVADQNWLGLPIILSDAMKE